MSIQTKPEHHRLAAELVEETHANDGLAPIDLERFYQDQEVAAADPFGEDIPQCPLGIWMNGRCVFDELGIEVDHWRYLQDAEWRLELNRRYNDKAKEIVGKRLLNEDPPDPDAEEKRYPPVKGLAEIFEGEHKWQGESWWLQQVVDCPEDLSDLLDRVERRLENLRDFMLPDEWDEERDRLMAMGIKPNLYRHQRGPVTFATSIYGVENLIFLLADDRELGGRFRDLILRAMLERARILDEEAGYAVETAPRGFSFADDNCALLTPDMYEFFGYPILKGVFDRYAPDPGDRRFQHSDSAMGHIVPILGRLNLTGTNFGPPVMVDHIREHLPNAVIRGQLAPFTFSRNEEENIVAEFLRDFEMAREERGLVFATAGSVNNGSRLTGLRLIMSAIQRYGQYE
jgi:uroporphyrinogen decarboxylase